jgi:hypothetical protein
VRLKHVVALQNIVQGAPAAGQGQEINRKKRLRRALHRVIVYVSASVVAGEQMSCFGMMCDILQEKIDDIHAIWCAARDG